MADKRSAGFYLGESKGIEEAKKALEEVKPKLFNELVDRMKAEAETIAKDIDSSLPRDAPLSGFNHSGRTSWAEKGSAFVSPSKSKPSSASGAQDWPVYKIGLGGAASNMADIAGAGGRGSTDSGVNMIAMLNSRQGRASRWVWPVGRKHMGRIEKQMQAACDRVAEETSRRMAAGG